ncbi:hypothetical protein [Mesorhizobium marinum]|uniref:hypothetical protein n=1 Tax=Mesorhizobium marinum TaxID=3228790 RepID=UPI00346726FE
MADDRQSRGELQRHRRRTRLRFGRLAHNKSKPGIGFLRLVGAAAILAAFVAGMVLYGPARGKHGIFHDWFVQRREAQRQREVEADLQRALKVKRDAEQLQRKAKAESEAALKQLNEGLEFRQQPAPKQ